MSWKYFLIYFILFFGKLKLTLKSEKYEHAKTKLNLMELTDKNRLLSKEVEYLKLEIEKERKAYENV
jgi:hypothetical protein